MTDLHRQANVLGALAYVVRDRTSDAMTTVVDDAKSETTAAALSALYDFLDRPSIDVLRQVLGLTPSGAVRLVDRLAQLGYVTRGPGTDGRTRVVTLTADGRHAAEQIRAARADVLRAALGTLSPDERRTFEELVGKVLAGFVRDPGATKWACRLCDTHACERHRGKCPIAEAAAARHGAAAVYGSL